jgi:hypothetical protein
MVRSFIPFGRLTALLAAVALPTVAQAATTIYLTKAAFLAGNPSAALLEDFESYAPKDVFTVGFATPTVTINAIAGGAGNVGVSSPGYTNYDPPNVATPSSIVTANGDEAFEVILATPSFAVGSDVYRNDFGPGTLTWYSGATIVGSYSYGATPNDKTDNWAFTGISTDVGPITRFTWISTLGGQLNTGIDNIYTVQAGAVPESATWLMMIVGFGAAGACLRRQNSRTSRLIA